MNRVTDEIAAGSEFEQQFKQVFDQGQIGMVIVGRDFKFIKASQTFCRITGYSQDDLAARSFTDITHPDHVKADMENMKRVISGQQPFYKTEKRYIRKDGATVWASVVISAVRDKAGDLLHFLAMIEDITARVESEERLRQSEDKFKSIFENMTEGVALHEVIYNEKGRAVNYRIVDVNPAYERHTGISPAMAKGKLATELYGTEAAPYLPLWAQVAETGKPHVMDVHFEPMKKTFSITSCSPKKGWFVTVFTDITEKNRIEAQLIQSEEKFRSLVETASDWIYEMDGNGVCTYAGPQSEALLGYKPEEVVGRKPTDFMTREEAERLKPRLAEILTSARHYKAFEYKCRHKNGSIVTLESSGVPVFSAKGKFTGYRGIVRDVTEHKRMEEHLIAVTKAVEATGDAIGISDAQGRHFYQNMALSRLFEYATAEELQAAGGGPAVVKDPKVAAAMFETIMSGKSWTGELEMVTKSGRVFPAYERADAIKDGEGKIVGLIGIITDFTERKMAEEKLAAATRQFRALFDRAGEGILVADAETHLFFLANPMICKLLGYSAEELVGKSVYDIHPPESLPMVLATFEAQRKGERTHAELPCLKKDGTIFYCNINATPAELNGRQCLIGLFSDITDRKLAEQALKESRIHLQCVLESTADGILAVDSAGKVIRCNHRFAEMWRIPEELTGTGDDKALLAAVLVQLKDPEAFLEKVRQLYNTDAQDLDVLSFKDGRIFERYSSPLIVDGCISGRVWSFRDVTRQRVAEKSILQLNRDLEQRVKDRTLRLEIANKELEAFAYSVSHDLRAPLRSIDGFSTAILEDYSDKLDDSGRDYLQRLRRSSQRMAALIDDLLKLSRVTSGEINISSVNLSDMAAGIISDLRKTESRKDVETVIAPEVKVSADPQLMHTVMENLIGNAWKFTSRKKKSKIEFGVTDRDGEKVYYVRDNGAGFDMAFVGKLFGAFQRLHSVEDFPGNGIGLASVQRVIHRHGGRVWAEGKPDKGAVLYFTLGPGIDATKEV